jgi:hypothetical protein
MDSGQGSCYEKKEIALLRAREFTKNPSATNVPNVMLDKHLNG